MPVRDAVELELACRAAQEAGWLPAHIDVAQTFGERLIGLQLASRWASCGVSGRVLAFPRCKSVHTYLMRRPIDIAFFAADGRVIEAHVRVDPGHVLSCPRAWGVIERISSAAWDAAFCETDFQKSFAFSLDPSF